MEQRRAYNIYLSDDLHRQLVRLTATGLSASAVARQAILKRPAELPAVVVDASVPVRTNFYVSADDSSLLSDLATGHGISRAEVLRRLITAYLDSNSEAISALF